MCHLFIGSLILLSVANASFGDTPFSFSGSISYSKLWHRFYNQPSAIPKTNDTDAAFCGWNYPSACFGLGGDLTLSESRLVGPVLRCHTNFGAGYYTSGDKVIYLVNQVFLGIGGSFLPFSLKPPIEICLIPGVSFLHDFGTAYPYFKQFTPSLGPSGSLDISYSFRRISFFSQFQISYQTTLCEVELLDYDQVTMEVVDRGNSARYNYFLWLASFGVEFPTAKKAMREKSRIEEKSSGLERRAGGSRGAVSRKRGLYQSHRSWRHDLAA